MRAKARILFSTNLLQNNKYRLYISAIRVVLSFLAINYMREIMMKKLILIVSALLFTSNSYAAVDAKKIYFGGGLGFNSLSGLDLSDGKGFQILAGYDLPVKMGKGMLSVEVGYMDTGNMEFSQTITTPAIPPFFPATSFTVTGEAKAKGFWGNAVYKLPLQDKMNLLLRAGLDVGDDDGFMFGGGLGFQVNRQIEVRGEYVIREEVDSLQFNVIFRQ